MKFGRLLVGIFASASLTMFNVFLLVMLIWSVNVSKAQQFDSSAVVNNNQDLTSASAAVIQATDKRLRNLNGVTGNRNGQVPLVQKSPLDPSLSSGSNSNPNGLGMDGSDSSATLDNFMVDEEGYWREVKAIIGGVLGFWGGVGGLGTMFLVVVLSQRYCCKKDDDKDDGDG